MRNATNRRSTYFLYFTFNNPLILILVYEDVDVEVMDSQILKSKEMNKIFAYASAETHNDWSLLTFTYLLHGAESFLRS